jgi:hypothetical protein
MEAFSKMPEKGTLNVSKLMLYLKEKCPEVFIQLIKSKVVIPREGSGQGLCPLKPRCVKWNFTEQRS